MRIVWTFDAREDLTAIREHISRNSPYYAALQIRRLIESVRQLKRFPLSGRVVPEVRSSEYRELIRSRYRIVYRIRNETIEVLMVFHTSRDPDELAEHFKDL